MDAAVVLDASVWVSRFIPREIHHTTSRLWMERYIAEGGTLVTPALLQIEVAASVARQTGTPALGKAAVAFLNAMRAMRFVPLDTVLVAAAVEVASDLQLRAGDASYVAVASQLNIPLVSWDKEQVARASNLVTTYTPGNYTF